MSSLANFVVFAGVGLVIRYVVILPMWRRYKAERAEAVAQAILRAQANDEQRRGE